MSDDCMRFEYVLALDLRATEAGYYEVLLSFWRLEIVPLPSFYFCFLMCRILLLLHFIFTQTKPTFILTPSSVRSFCARVWFSLCLADISKPQKRLPESP